MVEDILLILLESIIYILIFMIAVGVIGFVITMIVNPFVYLFTGENTALYDEYTKYMQ